MATGKYGQTGIYLKEARAIISLDSLNNTINYIGAHLITIIAKKHYKLTDATCQHNKPLYIGVNINSIPVTNN